LSQDENTPEPDDIDIFFKDMKAYNRIKEKLMKKLNLDSTNKSKRFHVDTCFAIGDDNPCKKHQTIQLIKPYCVGNDFSATRRSGTVEQVLNEFDMTVTHFAITFPKLPCGNNIIGVGTENAVKDEEDKTLQIHSRQSNVHVAIRAAKYMQKGYKLSPDIEESLKRSNLLKKVKKFAESDKKFNYIQLYRSYCVI
jgi:hypothetical protein